MGKGRKLTVNIISAEGLANADGHYPGDVSDPFVICCFDGNISHELCRTKMIENSLNPVWDETFEIDISSEMSRQVGQGLPEPKYLTFFIYDGDVTTSQPLGSAGVLFKDLLRRGEMKGNFPIINGTGVLRLAVSMKRAKSSSMLSASTLAKVGGGVAVGAAAAGLVAAYLTRKEKKKQKKMGHDRAYGGGWGSGPSINYGYHSGDSSSDEGGFKPWWDMDDVSSRDSDNWFGGGSSSSSSDHEQHEYHDAEGYREVEYQEEGFGGEYGIVEGVEGTGFVPEQEVQGAIVEPVEYGEPEYAGDEYEDAGYEEEYEEADYDEGE